MARIGVAANASRVIEGGHHPTALFGGFGAATAAAKLLQLDVQGLLVAWGHVLSMASGSMQFSDEAVGTSVKRVHAGYAAQNGVMAAEFAQAGIDAPHRAIDGKYGFLALYGRNPRPEILDRVAGAPRAIHTISVKPYACCRLFHSMIDGLRATTDDFARPADSIRSIKVRGPHVLADQHMLRRPESPMAAQYSLPYVVGATMEFGPSGFEAYDARNLANDRILRWGDIIECHPDDDLDRQYPAHFGTSVEVSFSDGTSKTVRILDSIGTPANPMPIAAIRDKVRRLTRRTDAPFDFDRLEMTVSTLVKGSTLANLHKVLMAT
jgi:2-methylcitrate dehydratase PrpD